MSVVVTGVNGFVGRHLVQLLNRRHGEVRGLSRRPFLTAMPSSIELLTGDIRDSTSLAPAMSGVTTVFHLAGIVPARGDAASMWATNVNGTRNVASACVRAGVKRLVLVSSVDVYRPPLANVVPESWPVGGTDIYGLSKAKAESEARDVCQGKVDLVIVRPCQIYGPGDTSGYTRRLLRLASLRILPIAGWSARSFCLIHVRDVAAALYAAGEIEGIGGAIFNIAPESKTTLLKLARIYAEITGRRRCSIGLPIPEALLRAAFFLRWMTNNLRRGGDVEYKHDTAGNSHGGLLLGGPLYITEEARTGLHFRETVTLKQGLSELLAGNGMLPRRGAPGPADGR